MFQEILLLSPACICLFWAILLAGRWKTSLRIQKICAISFFVLALMAFGGLFLLEEYKGIRLTEQLSLMQTLCFSLPAIVIFYGLGFHLSGRTLPAPAVQPETEPIKATEPSEPQYKGYEKLLPEFNRLIEEEKIFLQNNLRREDLAHLLKTNRTYIADLIREEYQCGFSELINAKRIEYARELIRLHPGIAQEQLASKSGFTNTSTFSRTFKQYTGITFREYQKGIISEL